MSRDVVVLSAVRSAIGTFGGSLAYIDPCVLGGFVMKESITRSGTALASVGAARNADIFTAAPCTCLRIRREPASYAYSVNAPSPATVLIGRPAAS